ncbi:MAG: hypothetical protein H6924_04775 [Alphaproteobacteria bacterium]|nr:hypothetical protein [Alphaproteobacteria bacterium]
MIAWIFQYAPLRGMIRTDYPHKRGHYAVQVNIDEHPQKLKMNRAEFDALLQAAIDRVHPSAKHSPLWGGCPRFSAMRIGRLGWASEKPALMK